MPKQKGTITSLVAGLLMCLATMYLSYHHLKQPQILFDWAALIFSGLVTGSITFFVVWGHFQDDPDPDKLDFDGHAFEPGDAAGRGK